MEPNESNTSIVNPDQIDIFIIPAVCVDKKGHRIGYGKGYYDRTLNNISSNKKIVLAFDFQIIDSVTPQNFDRNVDFIATQKGVINTTKGESE